MWSLNAPDTDEATSIDACRSRLSATHARTARINAARDDIIASMVSYREHGQNSTLHTIPRHGRMPGTVPRSDMEYLYEGGLLRVGAGRHIYDAIMGLAPNSCCPYCGARQVRQLDHFLPKSRYPAFCVTPLNLVPSCSDCNKDKLDRDGDQLVDLPLHPYFEDVDSERWLKCEVQTRPAAVFLFEVDQDCNLPASDLQRLTNQFRILGLGQLYTTAANGELASRRLTLRNLHEIDGILSVRGYLKDEFKSADDHRTNSWRTAMYKSASDSDWFCDGGFDDTDLP